MVYMIFDNKGELIYTGHNWAYTRGYLDYLVKSSDCSFRLVVRRSPTF